MTYYLENKDEKDFDYSDIEEAKLCTSTGKIAGENCSSEIGWIGKDRLGDICDGNHTLYRGNSDDDDDDHSDDSNTDDDDSSDDNNSDDSNSDDSNDDDNTDDNTDDSDDNNDDNTDDDPVSPPIEPLDPDDIISPDDSAA